VFFLSHFNIHSIPRDIFASAGIVKHPLFTIPSHRLSHRSPAVYFNWWARWIKRWWCSPSVRPLGTVTDGINGDFRFDGTSLGDIPFKPPLLPRCITRWCSLGKIWENHRTIHVWWIPIARTTGGYTHCKDSDIYIYMKLLAVLACHNRPCGK